MIELVADYDPVYWAPDGRLQVNRAPAGPIF